MPTITVGNPYPSITGVSGVYATVSSTYTMASGQYLDGSPWIAASAVSGGNSDFSAAIISYSPASSSYQFDATAGNRTVITNLSPGRKIINGVMVNIPGDNREQGYDERSGLFLGVPWNPNLNRASDLLTSGGIFCFVNDIAVIASGAPSSTQGHTGTNIFNYGLSKDNIRTFISAKMPITFLSGTPLLDSEVARGDLYETLEFRPGAYSYDSRENNEVKFKISEFDSTRIPQILTEEQPGGGATFSGMYTKIGASANSPSPVIKPYWEDLYNATRYFVGDDAEQWSTERICAGYQSPGYGQYWGELVSVLLLKSLMICPAEEQEMRTKTLKNLAQWGIDLWSAWLDGREAENDGGQKQARKSIIMAAGVLLNDANMMDPDGYLGDHNYFRTWAKEGLGKFQDKHVYYSGYGNFNSPMSTDYGVGPVTAVQSPSAWWNGWYWGHNFVFYGYDHVSSMVGWQQYHPSGGIWDQKFPELEGPDPEIPGLRPGATGYGFSPWYPAKRNTLGKWPVPDWLIQNAERSLYRNMQGNTGNHGSTYAWGQNGQPGMGQVLFMLACGLGREWSPQYFGWTTQNTYGFTKPFFDDCSYVGLSGVPDKVLLSPSLYTNAPSMFPGSSVTIESYGISGLATGEDRNYVSYYFRKYRISNTIFNHLVSTNKFRYNIERVEGLADFSGPYLATNEDASWDKVTTWEIFQAPPHTKCAILMGEFLDPPTPMGNGYNLWISANTSPAAQFVSSVTHQASRYGNILHRMQMPSEPFGGPINNSYGIQAVFLDENDVVTRATNAYKLTIGSGGTDNPFPPPGPKEMVSDSELEVLKSGKIGTPRVKSYGSSYGEYKGNQLKDYDTPRPDDLNDKDAKDTVEFESFQRTIKDYILSRLGYPVVDVELDDFQIETCIDESISKLEYHAPDWMTQYATFETSGSINVYDLPRAIADNLNDVWYKRDFFKFGASPGSLEFDFAIMFFTNTGLFNNYNVSQYLLMQQYLKQVKNVLGQMSTWQLIGNRYLHLFPVPDSSEGVILEFRAFDPETIHHAYKNWVQRYSLCLAKEVLGGIRNKYQTLPGPGGGTRLNGESLIREASAEKEKLIEELVSGIEGPPLFDIS